MAFLACLCLTSCEDDDVEASGTIITVPQELDAFTRVVANELVDLNISNNTSQQVDLRVNENLENRVNLVVSNGILTIDIEDGNYRNPTFEVNVQLPELTRLTMNGATSATVNVSQVELELEVNGSAVVQLEGSADLLTTTLSGSGEINGFSFEADVLNTTSEDASDLEITCINELNGTVTGASTVSYRGNPAISATTSGAGNIENAN